MIRLDKFLAEAGVKRRKEIRADIKEGFVTVDSVIVNDPWVMIEEIKAVVAYKGIVISYQPKVYYMFHKPAGCITARADAVHKTVLSYFKPEDSAGLFPVGRLDKDTEGILLFTNDGTFEHELMHPKHHIPKTYFFWALGELTQEGITSLYDGVSIGEDEAIAIAKEVKVLEILPAEDAVLKSFRTDLRDRSFKQGQKMTAGTITITEGRKHQVKRMLKAVGCRILYLKRTAIGELLLDETLEKGKYRKLTKDEIFLLRSSCKNVSG